MPAVLVVTGPSGAGKGTLIRKLVERVPGIEVTVSATTRELRRGEENGREYWFLTDDDFLARVARGSGGLSGPALKPVALHAVSVCHEVTGLPIVGMGGIESGRDALEFAACGAHDIALGTVLFGYPGAPARVRAELVPACADAGVATPDDARALAKSPETGRKVPA